MLGLRNAGPDITAAIIPATPGMTLAMTLLLRKGTLNLRSPSGQLQARLLL